MGSMRTSEKIKIIGGIVIGFIIILVFIFSSISKSKDDKSTELKSTTTISSSTTSATNTEKETSTTEKKTTESKKKETIKNSTTEKKTTTTKHTTTKKVVKHTTTTQKHKMKTPSTKKRVTTTTRVTMTKRVTTTKRKPTTTRKPTTQPTTKKIIKVKSILITSSASGYVGGGKQLSVSVSPKNAANKRVKWSTSNSSVASVGSGGYVKFNRAGSAVIYCRATDGSGCTATCSVRVKNRSILVSAIKLNLYTANIEKGGTVKINATIVPSNATNKSLSWSSSNTSIATVNSNGVVRGKKSGTVTIHCKAKDGSGRSAQCIIKVK